MRYIKKNQGITVMFKSSDSFIVMLLVKMNVLFLCVVSSYFLL